MRSRFSNTLSYIRKVSDYHWTCTSCRLKRIKQVQWRTYVSVSPSKLEKPYYVTSPIFYVNAGMTNRQIVSLSRSLIKNSAPCRPSLHIDINRRFEKIPDSQGEEGDPMHWDR